MYCFCYQIRDRQGDEFYINYFVRDSFGGYKEEERRCIIFKEEILDLLNAPIIKKIGRYRTSFDFKDL